uniref:hypothetical protein n=1 Tax=Candidatus Magnetominusculus dajiuhuensis TaxID=3137712 RepID=UPI003B42D26D
GHFYFGRIGHFYFGITASCETDCVIIEKAENNPYRITGKPNRIILSLSKDAPICPQIVQQPHDM